MWKVNLLCWITARSVIDLSGKGMGKKEIPYSLSGSVTNSIISMNYKKIVIRLLRSNNPINDTSYKENCLRMAARGGEILKALVEFIDEMAGNF